MAQARQLLALGCKLAVRIHADLVSSRAHTMNPSYFKRVVAQANI